MEMNDEVVVSIICLTVFLIVAGIFVNAYIRASKTVAYHNATVIDYDQGSYWKGAYLTLRLEDGTIVRVASKRLYVIPFNVSVDVYKNGKVKEIESSFGR